MAVSQTVVFSACFFGAQAVWALEVSVKAPENLVLEAPLQSVHCQDSGLLDLNAFPIFECDPDVIDEEIEFSSGAALFKGMIVPGSREIPIAPIHGLELELVVEETDPGRDPLGGAKPLARPTTGKFTPKIDLAVVVNPLLMGEVSVSLGKLTPVEGRSNSMTWVVPETAESASLFFGPNESCTLEIEGQDWENALHDKFLPAEPDCTLVLFSGLPENADFEGADCWEVEAGRACLANKNIEQVSLTIPGLEALPVDVGELPFGGEFPFIADQFILSSPILTEHPYFDDSDRGACAPESYSVGRVSLCHESDGCVNLLGLDLTTASRLPTLAEVGFDLSVVDRLYWDIAVSGGGNPGTQTVRAPLRQGRLDMKKLSRPRIVEKPLSVSFQDLRPKQGQQLALYDGPSCEREFRRVPYSTINPKPAGMNVNACTHYRVFSGDRAMSDCRRVELAENEATFVAMPLSNECEGARTVISVALSNQMPERQKRLIREAIVDLFDSFGSRCVPVDVTSVNEVSNVSSILTGEDVRATDRRSRAISLNRNLIYSSTSQSTFRDLDELDARYRETLGQVIYITGQPLAAQREIPGRMIGTPLAWKYRDDPAIPFVVLTAGQENCDVWQDEVNAECIDLTQFSGSADLTAFFAALVDFGTREGGSQ